MKSNFDILVFNINERWPSQTSEKAQRYVNEFFDRERFAQKISAKVQGNHGTYTVSIQADGESIVSACSCYIGKSGYCHHCHALAYTFLQTPDSFVELKRRALEDVETVADLPEFLRGVTLDALVQRLKEQGITQKSFAESMGMSSQKLSAIKSSERRNHYYHELGAVKLACLWVLEKYTQEGELE